MTPMPSSSPSRPSPSPQHGLLLAIEVLSALLLIWIGWELRRLPGIVEQTHRETRAAVVQEIRDALAPKPAPDEEPAP